jgi:deoxyribodipyrimidine photolyase-related protein
MSKEHKGLVIFANQLVPLPELAKALPDGGKGVAVFMAEDLQFCSHYQYHQQKLVLILAAMRHYADELRDAGFTVHYHRLDAAAVGFQDQLQNWLQQQAITELWHFEIESKPLQSQLRSHSAELNVTLNEISSPMFLCDRQEFARFVAEGKTLQMARFYKQQRLKLDILLTPDGQPQGGQWSFDAENRKKLPRDVQPPELPEAFGNDHLPEVIRLVETVFTDHPGQAADFWWPTTRAGALAWLDDFLHQRLAQFGPYEDAMSQRSDTLFHSALSPLMNIGLLTPKEVVASALEKARTQEVPLASLEGFVRQIIGWREFIRGVYQNFSERQQQTNFWQHERQLADSWYQGNTGIPPLDHAIQTALKLGWNHHIPRLMVVANLMTLCEIQPKVAHRWFMEMYVDASPWVMGPNVYGMGLFSDGGIFATKPYICGSNYLLKMSDYKRGEWCDVVDGLYWRFIERHRDFFQGNPRLALMPKALDRLKPERRKIIFAAAEEFLQKHTRAS